MRTTVWLAALGAAASSVASGERAPPAAWTAHRQWVEAQPSHRGGARAPRRGAPPLQGAGAAPQLRARMALALAKRFGRRAQAEVSDSASPSASAEPTESRTAFPNLPSASAPPEDVSAGGADALEGVWALQPGVTVQSYVDPGSSTIMAFLPAWATDMSYNDDYMAWFDLQEEVRVRVAGQTGPVSVRVSPLLYSCPDAETYFNQPDVLTDEACFWAGSEAPEDYRSDATAPAGGAVEWALTPSNSSLYPSPLYFSSALWVRISGPPADSGVVQPSRYTVTVDTVPLPSPSQSSVPVFSVMPTTSARPTGMTPVRGRPLSLPPATPFQVRRPRARPPAGLPALWRACGTTRTCERPPVAPACLGGLPATPLKPPARLLSPAPSCAQMHLNEYTLTYMFIPAPVGPIEGLRGMNLTIAATFSDVEAWVTPFAYRCWGA